LRRKQRGSAAVDRWIDSTLLHSETVIRETGSTRQNTSGRGRDPGTSSYQPRTAYRPAICLYPDRA